MGTRNIIGVWQDGQLKVAQYSQWDGYPSGQGLECYNFLHELLNSDQLDLFRDRVREVKNFANDDECNDYVDRVGKDLCQHLSRDTGSDILGIILDGAPGPLYNNETFLLDGLFCEFAWIIDLDADTFEMYRGFRKTRQELKGKWRDAPAMRWGDPVDDYFPVSLAFRWKFDELPDGEEWLKQAEEAIETMQD